ncbi:hypothetical protein Pcinc_021524 [Petrolisthes cinctipes]|uniref:C-type lectin domain-containing protein n=2 Tax=Petrolisthes cinctipes TaxID=88211 RepID=A0AAE1FHI0_PETCI|nr:hypothetical protein Pcinc_021524 [Petrolisthes cinctipes]
MMMRNGVYVMVVLCMCVSWVTSTTSPSTPQGSNNTWAELKAAMQEAQTVLLEQARLLEHLLSSTLACHRSCAQGWWCPLPYREMLAECFYLSSHDATWQEARSHCLALGGDLATPTNIARLFSYTLDTGALETDRVWVGGTDLMTGSWRWLNGRSIPRADWAGHQPNNWGGNQHCLNLRLDLQPHLNDADCDLEYRFVCQYFRPE